jgi:(S)-2-hydroxy-acid oxidase
VELAINLLYDEFRNCMALAGCVTYLPSGFGVGADDIDRCKNISEISRDHVSLLQQDGRLLKL